MKIFKSLFLLTFLLLSLAQLTSLSKDNFSNLYLFDIGVIGFALFGFLYFLLVKKSFVLPSVSILFFTFSGLALVSLIKVIFSYNLDETLTSFMYFFRWLSYLMFAIVIYNLLHQRAFSKDFIVQTFLYSGVFISIVGIIQFLFFPDLSVLDKSFGWDPHKFRLFSTFLDPNYVGAYINLCLLFLIDKYYKEYDFSSKNLSFTLILLISLVLTFSRSAWLMFSIIILIYGLFKSKLLLYSFLIVCFSAYFAVPRIQTRLSGVTDPADSAHFRVISWKNSLSIAEDNLIIGVGFNAYRFAQRDYNTVDYSGFVSHGASGSDSSLLLVLATTGIFGLMFFMSGFVKVLFSTKNILYKALILSLLFESFFINSIFYPQIMIIWLIMIICYSIFDTLS